MALILKDRVKETSSSSGTGNITLGGAFPGYQTFNAAIASGSTVYYTIHNLSAGVDDEWEVGIGTFTSTATLSRDTVLSSSTGSKVNFTAGVSGLEVFITQPAEEAVYLNQATGKVEIGGNGTNVVTFTEINTTNLTANTVTLTAGTISTNAANATDITNKTYVDNLFSTGITYHDPVLVESPTALIATYNQPGGAGNGVGATLTNSGANVALSIDGVSLSNTARVLVYQQSNAVQNGVYTVTNAGAPDAPGPGAAWVLTRATDADTYGVGDPNKLGQGDAFFVTSGNTGAGETYILNTVGTITFGTTNLTFAQISSAQVYSAGTGLNLTNLTFSISNTAVTAAQYGSDGAVGQFTVNAQGQITNAANVSINASSITLGTLANDRTTAASANGASTIVLRDSNGDFAANTITATTSNATTFNGTTGAFTNVSGNGVALTAINASNIASGTIANARTTGNTANSANTLVLRDANGSFGANIITATFSGNGATLSAINASNISSGTIDNARTTAASANGASTIVARDSGGSFTANTGTFTSVSGNGIGLTAINASNIASGTIANARTTASSSNGASTIVLRGASGEFAAGAITGASFSGNGSALTAINASAITTGTLDNARTNATSANGASTLVVRDANGSFAGNVITGTTGTFTNLSGNGSSLTAINASNISSGTIANARTTAATANGASTIVLRGTSGEFSAGAITGTSLTSGSTDGVQLAATGSIEIYRSDSVPFIDFKTTSAEDYDTRIQQQSNGLAFQTGGNGSASERMRIFSSGGVSIGNTTDPGATNLSVTGTIAGNGAPLTAINASNIASGTIANARTTAATANGASTIVLRGASGEFSAGAITATTGSFSGTITSTVGGQALNLNGGTSNRIDWNINGVAAPTFTTRSAGTKLVLYPAIAAAAGDYAIGIEGGNLWFSGDTTTAGFKWYGGTTLAASLTGTGNLTTVGTVQGTRLISTVATGTAPFTVTSTTQVANLNAATAGTATNQSGGTVSATSIAGTSANISGVITSNIGAGASAYGRYNGTDQYHSIVLRGTVSGTSTQTVTGGDIAEWVEFGGVWNFRKITTLVNTVTAAISDSGFALNVGSYSGNGSSISAINASNIASGTVATARLATGTANSSTYLRGDQTWAAVSGGTLIPSGTVMLFAQTAAPTGFTKNTTTGDNSALRVTTGTASTGGSVAFTTAFASQTPTGSVSITAVAGSAGATTLSTPQIPSHTHPNGAGPRSVGPNPYENQTADAFVSTTGATGGGGSHTHPFSFTSGSGTFTGNAINLAVQYIDVIRATKD